MLQKLTLTFMMLAFAGRNFEDATDLLFSRLAEALIPVDLG